MGNDDEEDTIHTVMVDLARHHFGGGSSVRVVVRPGRNGLEAHGERSL